MAKYNAIYEGRLPPGMYNRIMTDKTVTCYQESSSILLNTINKIYKKIIGILF